MTDLTTFPPEIRPCIAAALEAVAPDRAVRRALTARPAMLETLRRARRLVVLALGKAAYPMAQGAQEALARDFTGVLATKQGYAPPAVPRFQVIFGGHPVPNRGSQRAAAAMLRAVCDLDADDAVLFLLSGGGSALATAPHFSLTLADVQHTTRLLLASGATIQEVNTVRKHVDAFKGGGLARAAAPAPVFTLILSDVLGDPLDAIASGPTAPDPTTFADAWAVLQRYGLTRALPHAVLAWLQRGLRGEAPETPKPRAACFAAVTHVVVGNVATAAEAAVAAARAAGFHSALATTTLQGEAREIGRALTAVLQEMARHNRPLPRPACVVLGGETTVTLGETYGQGGRNQELALAAVAGLAGLQRVALVAFATDGADGTTDAAGAIATGATWARAQALGLTPDDFLRSHNAHAFWEAAGGLLRTGPTQTNVNDLVLLVTLPHSPIRA